jgi:hypothetical protein
MAKASDLYEQDFYAWSVRQAALLRAGKLSEADIENIVEEIESMGRGEKRELVNRLVVLILHLLKWRYQPAFQSKSWQLTVKEQRRRLATHLEENPSLKGKLPAALSEAYDLAKIEAERQTGLAEMTFPATCPFTFEQMMDADFWPDA